MIICQNVGLRYGARKLFDEVDIKFTPGNCYGLIGANGAGKSTFLKILSGEIPSTSGHVFITGGHETGVLDNAPLSPNHLRPNMINTISEPIKKITAAIGCV